MDQEIIFPGEGNGKGFYHADYLLLLFSERMERAHCDRTLLVLDKKIPDWLTKIMFLVEVETAIRAGIKSRFGIMGF